jgi:hypothetical protein
MLSMAQPIQNAEAILETSAKNSDNLAQPIRSNQHKNFTVL